VTPQEANRMIADIEKAYLITRTGKIIKKGCGNIIKGYNMKSGHNMIEVMGYRIYRHRLVALKYLPNPKNYKTVNHKDGNPQNNRVGNLEWCTQSENAKHYYNNLAAYKFDKSDIDFIRDVYKNKAMTQWQIAEVFNTKQGYISEIVNRKKHDR
jgi:hypothetical protein